MSEVDLARSRLHNQGLAGSTFGSPVEVVSQLGAVQAQDYLGGLWAVGLRLQNSTEKDIERALAERVIVRTWPMRGTLHFVAAEDVRWMQELLAPRVIERSKARLLQQYGLEEPDFSRSRTVLVRALEGARQLTRPEVYRSLETAGISTAGQRGLQILWRLAQEGLICYGPRAGKQQTFVLLDDWLPRAQTLPREQALVESARRYFRGHGPASIQDFAWWSGLVAADAQKALSMIRQELVREMIGGREYWQSPAGSRAGAAEPGVHLLPPFDEFTVGYKERGAALHAKYAAHAPSASEILSSTILLNGKIVGNWKRVIDFAAVTISLKPSVPLQTAERAGLEQAAGRYAAFLGLPLNLA